MVLVESLGSDHMVHVRIHAPQIIEDDEAEPAPTGDSGICICRFAAQSRARPDTTARIAVDCEALHFFDPGTGVALRTHSHHGL